jgi:glycosyltransferase involved in cell wall biosynthesis
MKINVISFLDPNVFHGGGEMITRSLFVTALSRGHDVKISSVRPSQENFHDKPDLSIFVDVYNSGHTIASLGFWRGFRKRFIEDMKSLGPFVHMTNAYVDICNLPYLPCSGQSDDFACPVKHKLSLIKKTMIRDFGNTCFVMRDHVRSLYEDAVLNVYLSPLHKEVTQKLLGSDVLPESYLLSPMIDTKIFRNMGLERDIDYLFVGIISEAKGLSEIREKYQDENVHFVGLVSPDVDLDFGTYHGHVSYTDIPLYMNRAKNFLFLPRWQEPQGRVVSEAALCGCNIVGNKNVGALSFGMDLSAAANYEGVEEKFWLKLESLI